VVSTPLRELHQQRALLGNRHDFTSSRFALKQAARSATHSTQQQPWTNP
jgi:hypothetical protein